MTAPAVVGGLESVVRMLATGHARLGHRVTVVGTVSPAAAEHPFLTALREGGTDTVTISVPTRSYGQERAALAELIRSEQPDIVHTHGYRADVVDAGVARSAGVPIVTTVHGFTGGGWRNRLYEWLQERAMRRFDAVVAVSTAIAQRLDRRGVPRDRLHVVANAFDADAPRLTRAAARARLGLRDNDFAIGWVGRMSAEKGPDQALAAVAAAANASMILCMIGDGPERGLLERRAAQAAVGNAAPRVRWYGVLPDAGSLFPAFDAYLLSSRTEGVPIVLLEAMAAGVPIVATRVGGVGDMLEDGREAILAPAGDVAALVEGLTRVQARPDEARAGAAAARRRLERDFAIRPWLERYEEIYRTVRARA